MTFNSGMSVDRVDENEAMTHFGLAAWADLARGLVSEDEVGPMRAHLASGCADCQDIAQFLTKMATVSRRLAGGSVPPAATRFAMSIFPIRFAEPRRLARIVAELIFDSRTAPAPAGTRSTWHVGWQCVYRAGDCLLDLRIEPELSTSRAAVIGQISNQAVPGNKLSGLTVRLKSGRFTVAETHSNQFGEFQLEYEQQTRLQLCVYMDGDSSCIQVPLKRFAPDKPGLADHLNLQAIPGRRRDRTSRA